MDRQVKRYAGRGLRASVPLELRCITPLVPGSVCPPGSSSDSPLSKFSGGPHHAAWGILVPRTGIQPSTGAWVLTTGLPAKSLPYCLDTYSFVVSFETRKWGSSDFALLFLDFLAFQGLLLFHMTFGISAKCQKSTWDDVQEAGMSLCPQPSPQNPL